MARAEFFQSTTPSGDYSLIVVAHDPVIQTVSLVPLRSQHTTAYLLLLVGTGFRIDVVSGAASHARFQARLTGYKYQIYTREQRELAAFHWHPSSFSRFRTPHVHVSGANPISLDSSTTSGGAGFLDIGKAHFPTRYILLEDVVEMLIADPVFAVEPRRADWRQVLSVNRAAQSAELG